MVDFVSLHNHSQYSILQALPSPKELLLRAKELGQEAIAVSDYGSLAGVWDFHKLAKEIGIKFIPGCEFYFTNSVENKEEKLRSVVLLAKNAVGYTNLLRLHRGGFDHHSLILKKVTPVIDWESLKTHSEGLICLTACGNGIIGQLINNKKFDEAEETLKKLIDIFGENLGAEIQAHNAINNATNYRGAVNQIFTNTHIIRLATKYNVRIIPTSNTHYISKEDSETHDIELAIGSGQPHFSNNRMKFNTTELYLKSGEEIKTFFSRNYGEEFAENACKNTKIFSDMCEDSVWIDPKFSNPSGKELPTFPVKDQPDYNEFLGWLDTRNELIRKLDEDKSYLRFCCERAFLKKVPKGKEIEYRKRLELEIDTFYYTGISSYMLIVADYVDWAKKNGVSVGPGRGCLTGNTMVLTKNGYKQLSEISIGDYVYSHTGNLKRVINTFKFDVDKNEKLKEIRSNYKFNNLVMTPDHLVYVNHRKYESRSYFYNNGRDEAKSKAFQKCSEPEWKRADELTTKDQIFTPFLTREIKYDIEVVDLAKYNTIYDVKENVIEQIVYKKHKLSNRQIVKATGINLEFIRKLKLNIANKNNHLYNERIDLINKYLNTCNTNIEDWVKSENRDIRKIKRLISLDSDFMYFLGRWVGDGSFHTTRGLSIVFNSKDIYGIDKIYNYLTNLGFYVCKEVRKLNNTLLTVSNILIYSLIRELVPRYSSSKNKHFPDSFRSFDNDLLRSLYQGLMDSDGSVSKLKPNQKSITTTSRELGLQVKELLVYLGHPCSLKHSKNVKRYDVPCLDSFVISTNDNNLKYATNDGFSGGVLNVSDVSGIDYVYDITVEDDHSYLTANGIVHNSVAGSLGAYFLGIHLADPIKYGLVFERFYNKLKLGFSDVDCDFSQSGREKVISYITSKYGRNNVAQITNINKITPKVFIKDLARSLQLGGSREAAVLLGNTVADYVPAEIKSIEDAVKKCALFAESAKRNPDFIKHKKICNKPRAVSQHAAGLVIGTRPLTDIVPVRTDKNSLSVIELDKDKAEEVGLVKMDILGLETLDIIDLTYDLIKENKKECPEIDFEAYDEKTYNLIGRGDTLCVFQFGTSAGTVELCRRIKPKSIEDLAIITAIARPVSKAIREDLINVKNGKNKMKVMHPSLERAMKDTYGFSVYDESLLILSEDVAGWDLAEADKLRKLTKEKGKNPERAKKWREEFIQGAIDKKIDERMAIKIWEEIVEPFGNYGFNKSLQFSEQINVYTKDGNFIEAKEIQNINIGNFVRSRDEDTKQDIFVEVNGKYDHGKLPIVEIELIGGEKVKCTLNHKFRVEETRKMIPVWMIIENDLTITTLNKIKSVKYVGIQQTYDIGVNHKDHQFYLSNGVLTSNSHAVTYSFISYITAYLKTHYPIEFLLANLKFELQSGSPKAPENALKIKNELRKLGKKILPPDINSSDISYKILDDSTLVTGMEAAKFLGEEAMEDILTKRPFHSFEDFMIRVNSKKVKAGAVQALSAIGALDSFKIPRKLMFLYASDYRKKLNIWLKDHNPETEKFEYAWPDFNEWSAPERFALEHKYLGEALICGKKEAYNNGKFYDGKSMPLRSIRKLADKTFLPTIKAEIKSIFEFKIKKETSRYLGQDMLKAVIEDEFGEQISVTLFPDSLKKAKQSIKNSYGTKYKLDVGISIHFNGTINLYEDELGIIVRDVFDICPPPTPPKDLEAKKITLKRTPKKKKVSGQKETAKEITAEIEDELFSNGYIDLDAEEKEEDEDCWDI